MRVFTTTKFKGHYPVGTAAVVAATSRKEAAILLNEELRRRGLKGELKREDMIGFGTGTRGVKILCDGNY